VILDSIVAPLKFQYLGFPTVSGVCGVAFSERCGQYDKLFFYLSFETLLLQWPKPNYSDTISKPGCKSNILVIFFNCCHSFMTSINLHATSTFFTDAGQRTPTNNLYSCTYKHHNLKCVVRLKFKIVLQLTPKDISK